MNRAYWLAPVLTLALLPSNVVSAAMPLLLKEWSAPNTEGGIVFAAYQLGYVLSVLVLLPLTDRVRAGVVIAGCALVTSLSFLLFPLFAVDVWSASALRFLAGLGLAGIYLPGVRIVAVAATPQRRGLAVGTYVAAFYLGTALSLWAAGVLLPALAWRGAATVLAVIGCLSIPLALFSTHGMPAPQGRGGRLDPGVLRDPPIARNVIAYTGHSWELYVSRAWLAAFIASVLVTQGFDANRASADGSQWSALMVGFGTPGVFLGGWLSDHLGRTRAALLITALSGLLSLVFGFLGNAPWLVLLSGGCLYGLLVSADSAIYSTAITELAEPARLGSAQAVQAFVGFSATIIAPVAAGKALDLGWSWGAVFGLAGVVGLAFGLPMLYEVITRKNPTAKTQRTPRNG